MVGKNAKQTFHYFQYFKTPCGSHINSHGGKTTYKTPYRVIDLVFAMSLVC